MFNPGQEYAGQTVLLTGGLGFLGSIILEQLLRLTEVSLSHRLQAYHHHALLPPWHCTVHRPSCESCMQTIAKHHTYPWSIKSTGI